MVSVIQAAINVGYIGSANEWQSLSPFGASQTYLWFGFLLQLSRISGFVILSS